MKFELSFTNKEVTPWGGMVFLKQMLDKIGFREQIEDCISLPSQNSNRAYSISVLLESFITSIWCGATRFLHTEVTRSDRALGKIFGWEHTPGQDAYKRYFGKFTQSVNQEVSDALLLCQTSSEKLTLRQKQVQANETALENNIDLMKHSSNTYLEILIAQSTLLQSKLMCISDWYEGIQGQINLYKALGGGVK